jgi:hypothetical protein
MFAGHRLSMRRPKMDYPQELRVRRLFIAIAGYGVIAAAILACYWAGFVRVLSFFYVLLLLLSVFVANGLIFLAIVKGINKKFKDPSMTTIQLFIGIIFTTILCYYMEGELRGTGCLIYTMVFVFGTFKTQLLKLFLLSFITTAMYAASMFFLHYHDPSAVDFRLEVLRSGILLMALLWISYMASYIALLRLKIKKLSVREIRQKLCKTQILDFLRLHQGFLTAFSDPAAIQACALPGVLQHHQGIVCKQFLRIIYPGPVA